MPHPPAQQIPGFYHRRVGDIVVTALSDGYLDSTLAVMHVEPAEAERILKDAFRPSPPRISINAFLVYSAGRLALIETGSGTTMGPTLGWIPRNLEAAGVAPGDIESVLLTHVHPDHSNGLIFDDGRPFFPTGDVVVHEADVKHWHDDAAMARAPERQQIRYFQQARRALAPYRSRLRTFQSGGSVFPGVTAMPIPGHTPGHTAYLIESKGERLLVWGDIVHVPEVQFARPDLTLEFDTDGAAAAVMRRKVLEMVVAERLLVAGMHLHFPGFGHVARSGERYAYVPEAWQHAI